MNDIRWSEHALYADVVKRVPPELHPTLARAVDLRAADAWLHEGTMPAGLDSDGKSLGGQQGPAFLRAAGRRYFRRWVTDEHGEQFGKGEAGMLLDKWVDEMLAFSAGLGGPGRAISWLPGRVEQIAAVVNRSNIFYSLVDKNRRPEKQQPVVESEHVTGHALYVRVDRTEQANGLVEHLADLEGTAVITAADEPPAWLDERRRTLVLTPGEAKGLEYQRVCVLDVGAAIEAFDGNVTDDRTPLRQESRRTAIDQLRVALSRATETLAVVNVEPDARQDLSTLALVGGAGRYNQDDIIARFGDETATPEERTSERIRRVAASVTAGRIASAGWAGPDPP